MKHASYQPILIIIRGLPGSGKTSIAKGLKDRLKNKHCVRLDPDSIDYKGEVYKNFIEKLRKTEPQLDAKFFPYRFLRTRAIEALGRREIVIWEQPWSSLKGLKITLEKLSKIFPSLSTLIVEVEITPEEARKRIKKRVELGGHGPDDKTFKKFVEKFDYAKIGYRRVVLKGHDKVNNNVDLILKALESKYETEI